MSSESAIRSRAFSEADVKPYPNNEANARLAGLPVRWEKGNKDARQRVGSVHEVSDGRVAGKQRKFQIGVGGSARVDVNSQQQQQAGGAKRDELKRAPAGSARARGNSQPLQQAGGAKGDELKRARAGSAKADKASQQLEQVRLANITELERKLQAEGDPESDRYQILDWMIDHLRNDDTLTAEDVAAFSEYQQARIHASRKAERFSVTGFKEGLSLNQLKEFIDDPIFKSLWVREQSEPMLMDANSFAFTEDNAIKFASDPDLDYRGDPETLDRELSEIASTPWIVPSGKINRWKASALKKLLQERFEVRNSLRKLGWGDADINKAMRGMDADGLKALKPKMPHGQPPGQRDQHGASTAKRKGPSVKTAEKDDLLTEALKHCGGEALKPKMPPGQRDQHGASTDKRKGPSVKTAEKDDFLAEALKLCGGNRNERDKHLKAIEDTRDSRSKSKLLKSFSNWSRRDYLLTTLMMRVQAKNELAAVVRTPKQADQLLAGKDAAELAALRDAVRKQQQRLKAPDDVSVNSIGLHENGHAMKLSVSGSHFIDDLYDASVFKINDSKFDVEDESESYLGIEEDDDDIDEEDDDDDDDDDDAILRQGGFHETLQHHADLSGNMAATDANGNTEPPNGNAEPPKVGVKNSIQASQAHRVANEKET